MKFSKAEIYRTNCENGRPGEIAVVEQFDASGEQTRGACEAAQRYTGSMGASFTYWKTADARHLGWCFIQLAREGYDPKQVHQEFQKIDEYNQLMRDGFLDDPTEFHEITSLVPS